MNLTLSQILGIALSITGESIQTLAKRWGCSTVAIHRVVQGNLSSKPLKKKIASYIESALSCDSQKIESQPESQPAKIGCDSNTLLSKSMPYAAGSTVKRVNHTTKRIATCGEAK